MGLGGNWLLGFANKCQDNENTYCLWMLDVNVLLAVLSCPKSDETHDAGLLCHYAFSLYVSLSTPPSH